MTSDLLLELIRLSPVRRFPRHALIIQEGDDSDELFVLLNGRVRSFSMGDDGREVHYSEYAPVEIFGELALDGQPRSASIQALEASECSVVSTALLKQFVRAQPDFAFELISRLTSKARQATASARNLALLDVYGRLRVFLESQPNEMLPDGRRTLTEKFTHQAIATRIGASREMVSKLLSELEKGEHVLKSPDGHFKLGKIPKRW